MRGVAGTNTHTHTHGDLLCVLRHTWSSQEHRWPRRQQRVTTQKVAGRCEGGIASTTRFQTYRCSTPGHISSTAPACDMLVPQTTLKSEGSNHLEHEILVKECRRFPVPSSST